MNHEVKYALRIVELLEYQMELANMSRTTVYFLLDLVRSGKLSLSESGEIIDLI